MATLETKIQNTQDPPAQNPRIEMLFIEEKRRLIERNEVTSRRSDFSKESSYESQFR